MDIIEAIYTRRSIRKYSQEKVNSEQVEQLLKAAMYAPSAGNQQAWHFVVIRDKNTFCKINEFHPFSKMLENCSVAILVCGDTALETKPNYWPVDCSAATQNILLTAHGIGLGAVWLGIYPRPERAEGMRKILNLPDNIQPFSLISIGYAAESKPTPERYKPERVKFETWC